MRRRQTPAGFSGPRCLDRRVKRQQVGLAGDRTDQAQHIADLFGGGGKASDHFGGLRGLGHGLVGDTAGNVTWRRSR